MNRPVLRFISSVLGVLLMTSAGTTDPFLPTSGAVIRSGGLVSTSRIVVYDQPTCTLRAFVSRERRFIPAGTPLGDAVKLDPAQCRQVKALIRDITTAPDRRVFMAEQATADWDVVLTARQARKVTSVQSFGPPRGALKTLYDLLWSIVDRPER